jgi:hypothetical protein
MRALTKRLAIPAYAKKSHKLLKNDISVRDISHLKAITKYGNEFTW